jgi:hypothetical protein
MEGKSALLYKTLVVGIIVLFIGMGVQPVIGSIQPFIESEVKDIPNPEPLNEEYVEIKTNIHGVYTNFQVNSGFIIRDVTITANVGLDYLRISGLRWEEGKNLPVKFTVPVEWVRAPVFIGFCYQTFHQSRVNGIAFGNIEYKRAR